MDPYYKRSALNGTRFLPTDWVGHEKKGVSKIFFRIFLTSYKHSMAKKSDRTDHSFSDPTLKTPSKDPKTLLEKTLLEKILLEASHGIDECPG